MPVPSSLNLQPEANTDDNVKDSTTTTTTTTTATTEDHASLPSSPTPPDSPRSNEDLAQNKLFVGALSWDTTENTLKSFFSGYGEVLDCVLMLDGNRKSRGFGFVTFKNPETVHDILEAHAKEAIKIDDKIVDPKLAVPRRGKVRRIFVGGLSSDTSEEDMKEFFKQFGEVEEAQLMYDRQTSRHRGFGFVTFEKPGPAEKVCSIQFHDIKGKKVEVKVAQTKEALAGKAKPTYSPVYGQNTQFNYSPTYPPFYPAPYPIELYGPQMVMGGSKQRGVGGANKMRMANQYSPPAFFGGYSYSPSEPNGHMTSPQYYSSFNGMPSPFFMRPDPTLPLSSPPLDFIEQFQAMAMISGGNPYAAMSPGSPPNHTIPVSITAANSTFSYQNGETMGTASYSPPTGISPKGSPSETPVNGYTQVPNNVKSSYPMQQTIA